MICTTIDDKFFV